MEAVLRRPEAFAAGAAAFTPDAGERTLLRFITCGSVDDGKSTLIGRMLFEAGAVPDDQLAAVARDSQRYGTTGGVDYALLVDGLAAEREQGITIDVAYRYFSTARRAFIVADTPGHEQYTRNMATGASTADLAVILVDARKGLLPQTRRHSFIVALVGIRHAVVAVNKMDLVGYDEAVFRRIEADYRALVRDLGFASITVIPVAARDGENVVRPSVRMPWYRGPALLPWLETVEVNADAAGAPGGVMPVQWVNRAGDDFRGYAGMVATGRIRAGDPVVALPSGLRSRVERIVTADGDLPEAVAGQSVTLTLADAIDVSRGDVLALPEGAPGVRRTTRARLLWTSEQRLLRPGARFVARLGTAVTDATVVHLHAALDIGDFSTRPAETLAMNAIGWVTVAFDVPLVMSDFARCHDLGAFILIDRTTNETVAFGFVESEPAAATQPANEPAAEPQARLRVVAERLLGPAGSRRRRERLIALSWHVPAAVLLGLVVGAVSGSVAWGLAAAAADFILRPLLRRAHGAAVRRALRPRAKAELHEHGGGI
jgi:bifunctional enzyme CysN/CysC